VFIKLVFNISPKNRLDSLAFFYYIIVILHY